MNEIASSFESGDNIENRAAEAANAQHLDRSKDTLFIDGL